ncbi:MAG: hypothetical protein CBC24_01000 [Candidatus Pelagibacter sp. TMED64]|nr:hypothetical protein [Candidatus Pelagibacter sp.]OUU67605.1 MAG: hypothetical protein CBC24_01000 [Candidatus Pelagibacter sp. TMED64]|tara:strand:- start:97 stop:702 length:606 start_codon:yes stop_codon:yes gene_type:complete
MRSLSEIDVTSKRASKAAGFSWGISEEVGKAIRTLELFGLPGLNNLNLYLKKIKKKHPKKIKKINKINKEKEICPIYYGVTFLDRCMELDKLKKIKVYNIKFPLLLIPFISKASEILGKKIKVEFDNIIFLTNFNKSIFISNKKKIINYSTKKINIEFIKNTNSFSEKDWKELYKLSVETFVDESESSKSKGAGAGTTDND